MGPSMSGLVGNGFCGLSGAIGPCSKLVSASGVSSTSVGLSGCEFSGVSGLPVESAGLTGRKGVFSGSLGYNGSGFCGCCTNGLLGLLVD